MVAVATVQPPRLQGRMGSLLGGVVVLKGDVLVDDGRIDNTIPPAPADDPTGAFAEEDTPPPLPAPDGPPGHT